MGGNLSNSFLSVVLTDNVNNTYSAGDRVDGVVYFNSKDDCQCRTIQLAIEGSEYLMFKVSVACAAWALLSCTDYISSPPYPYLRTQSEPHGLTCTRVLLTQLLFVSSPSRVERRSTDVLS